MTRRILVADDNRRSLEVMALLLESRGHAVTPVEDGLQALDLALATQPDVLVLDLAMPGLAGDAVARRVRDALGARWAPRLVALSGHVPDTVVASGLFDTALQKPVLPAHLFAAVE